MSPVQSTSRTVAEDLTLGERTWRRGCGSVPWAATNRDWNVCPNASEADVGGETVPGPTLVLDLLETGPGAARVRAWRCGADRSSTMDRGRTPGLAASGAQAGLSPGAPASVTKDAAVVTGAPGLVTYGTVLKSARAASCPSVTVT